MVTMNETFPANQFEEPSINKLGLNAEVYDKLDRALNMEGEAMAGFEQWLEREEVDEERQTIIDLLPSLNQLEGEEFDARISEIIRIYE